MVSGIEQIGSALGTKGIYVKNYGPGSLATISMLGGSSSQSLIKWQDIPINNPMLGLSDLSLINLRHFDNAVIKAGGASTTEGQGAITGVIDLSQDINPDNGLSLEMNAGSLGLLSYFGQVRYTGEKVSLRGSYEHSYVKNEFDYTNSSSTQTKKQTHGTYENQMITQHLAWTITPTQSISLDIWWQDAHRLIPPTTVQNRSEAQQRDKVQRYVINYKIAKGKSLFQSKVAWFDETNDYLDPQILLQANNRFKKFFHQSHYDVSLGENLSLTADYNLSVVKGRSESYEEKLSTLEAYIASRYTNNSMEVLLGLKTAYNDFSSMPLVPYMSLEKSLSDKINVKFNLSQEFRFPTLNDLFWIPNSSNTLLPEKGWNQELSFNYNHGTVSFSSLIFHRVIDNWILWAQEENAFFFTPTNLSKVRSYGASSNVQYACTECPLSPKIELNYNYIVSENLEEIQNPKIKKGDPLLYTPKHNFAGNLTAKINRSLSAAFNFQYFSSSTGINENLDDYFLCGLGIFKIFQIEDQKIELNLVAKNLLNANYRVIERRPMPGRQLYFKIKYSI